MIRQDVRSYSHMEAVWITLIVFVSTLIVFIVLVIRFPEELRSLVSRTASIRIGSKGIAWTIFEEAVREKEHRTPKRKEASGALTRISGGRIVWVDDSPANNLLEVQTLRSLGVQVDTATSNDEAVQYATVHTYDLVLSDIERAPPQAKRAGLELPAQLRDAGRDVPVAYYVGHADRPQTTDGQPVFDTPTALFGFVADQLGSGAV